MAKNTIKLINSFTGQIVAGRVNPKTNVFVGDKEVVTESAIDAVAEYLFKQGLCLYFKQNDKQYVLEVREVLCDEWNN